MSFRSVHNNLVQVDGHRHVAKADSQKVFGFVFMGCEVLC